jgi:hypothetical protein
MMPVTRTLRPQAAAGPQGRALRLSATDRDRNCDGKAQPSRDTSHGLHPEEKKSLLVTPDGDYMGRILGCGPAGLRQSRGPLGKCSSCDVTRLGTQVANMMARAFASLDSRDGS